MHAFINKATTALRNTSKILLRGYDNLESTPQKIATQTQRLREKLETKLYTDLSEIYPQHEFAFPAFPTNNQAEIVWHIDVLNGQENFQHGIPQFAMVITICEKLKPQHTLIYDPILQECFSASKGQHAQIERKRLRVTSCKELNETLIGSNLNLEFKATRQTGCNALQLAYVAAGRLDAFIGDHLSYHELTAGNLLVNLAGGLCSDWQGGNNTIDTNQLIATNKYLLKPLLQAINNSAPSTSKN